MSEKNSSSWQEKVLDPVAAHIGKRMRERREVLGLTSDDVARRVGMSLQQAEECEKGLRTVSGQDLWRFCQVLEVEPNYFFLGLQKKIILLSAEMRQERLREELYGIPLSREQEKRETAELTSYYYSLPPHERHLFFYLMKETMYFVLKEREI